MKKIIAWILSVMMLLTLLSACGKETAPQETGTQVPSEVQTEPSELPQAGQQDNGGIVYLLASAEQMPQSCGGTRRKNIMEYDVNGNLISRICDEYDYTYSYNAENQMNGWKRLRKDGSVHEERIYRYGDNGKVSSWSYQISEYTFTFENTYDDQDNLIKVICTRNGEAYSEEINTYDAEGRLVDYQCGSDHLMYTYEENKTVVTDIRPNGTQYTDRITAYDENGNVIWEETYDEGELYTKETYTYDAAGKLISSTNWSSYNAGERYLEYAYDENGCLIEVTAKEGLGILYRLAYTYVQWQGDPQRAEQLRAIEIDEFWD